MLQILCFRDKKKLCRKLRKFNLKFTDCLLNTENHEWRNVVGYNLIENQFAIPFGLYG